MNGIARKSLFLLAFAVCAAQAAVAGSAYAQPAPAPRSAMPATRPDLVDPFAGVPAPTPADAASRPSTRPDGAQGHSNGGLAPGETAEQAFQRIYGARLTRAAQGLEKFGHINMANQLLSDGKDLDTPAALRTLLLEKAYDMGLFDCTTLPIALQALDEIVRLHPSRRAEIDEKILEIYDRGYHCPRADTRAIADRYYKKCAEMAEGKVRTAAADEEDAYQAIGEAIDLYLRAVPAARIVGRVPHADVMYRVQQLKKLQSIWGQIHVARKNYNDAPAGAPEARKAASDLVRLLAIELDRPDEAAEYVGYTQDPVLIEMMPIAARDPATMDESEARELAEWYRKQSAAALWGKVTALYHAKLCYQRVLAIHTTKDVGWLEAKAALGEIELEGAREEHDQQVKDNALRNEILRGHHAHF